MRDRRALRPQRKPIFVGCEGESEQSYVGFIQDLIDAAELPIHLNIEPLRAGDPLARVEYALSRLARLRKSRSAFAQKFVLLDTDQLSMAPQRAAQARSLAANNDISIVWQEPCFEAVLLRHFDGMSARRPPTSRLSETALKRVWPSYDKPMSRAQLGQMLDQQSVVRAANVEPNLLFFLSSIGLLA